MFNTVKVLKEKNTNRNYSIINIKTLTNYYYYSYLFSIIKIDFIFIKNFLKISFKKKHSRSKKNKNIYYFNVFEKFLIKKYSIKKSLFISEIYNIIWYIFFSYKWIKSYFKTKKLLKNSFKKLLVLDISKLKKNYVIETKDYNKTKNKIKNSFNIGYYFLELQIMKNFNKFRII